MTAFCSFNMLTLEYIQIKWGHNQGTVSFHFNVLKDEYLTDPWGGGSVRHAYYIFWHICDQSEFYEIAESFFDINENIIKTNPDSEWIIGSIQFFNFPISVHTFLLFIQIFKLHCPCSMLLGVCGGGGGVKPFLRLFDSM